MAIYTTPLATDQYSRVMAGRFDETDFLGNESGWLSFFGTGMGAETHYVPNANIVEIDIRRAGDLALAKMIHRGVYGTNIDVPETNVGKFSTFGRAFPLIFEHGSIDRQQLLNRQFGQSPYAVKNEQSDMRDVASDIHKQQVLRIRRTHEYLAQQSILTGKMPYIIGTTDTNWLYDFLRLSTHTSNAANVWDGGSQDILADADAACQRGLEDAHVKYDMAVVGSLAMTAMVNDTTLSSIADNRRIPWLNLDVQGRPLPPRYQKFVDGGMLWRGTLMTPAGFELYLFTYLGFYYDGSANQPWMPTKKVVFGYSDVRFDRYYGPSDRLSVTASERAWYMERFGIAMEGMMPPMINGSNTILNAGMFYFDGSENENHTVVKVRTCSAPIYATTHTDAVEVMTVLT